MRSAQHDTEAPAEAGHSGVSSPRRLATECKELRKRGHEATTEEPYEGAPKEPHTGGAADHKGSMAPILDCSRR
eukprot:7080279-Alexandrium_andersonii.AAC.1